MPILNVLRGVGDDLDAGLSVGETDDGDGTGLMDDGLGALFVREAVRDGYMAVALGVDARHLAAEEPAVGGGVGELVNGNEIMDHLMEDGVPDEFLGKVDAGVDAEDEVLVFIATEQTLFAAGKGHFAEKTLGVAEPDGDRRQGPAEEAGIVLVKTGLYVGNRGEQFTIHNS